MNVSFHDIKVFISKCNVALVEMTGPWWNFSGKSNHQEICSAELQRQTLRGKNVLFVQHPKLPYYSLENRSEPRGENGKADERIGGVLPQPPHHLIHRSADDALCPAPFQVSGRLQYVPPFVTLQLLMKWIRFSSWKWSSCESAVHCQTSRFCRRK